MITDNTTSENLRKVLLFAADLAGARVDPNEAQKAMAYLRSTRDSKEFFRYLRSINANGRAVIRSHQTLGYYRELLVACERHLHGLNADEMLMTLGWAIRLLRYYRAVPDAQIRQEKEQTTRREVQRQQTTEPARKMQDALSARSPESVSTSREQLPEAGATFTGKIMEVDEEVVIIEIPQFDTATVIGVLKANMISDGKTNRYQMGNMARVEVIQIVSKGKRTIVELKPGAKREKK